MTLGPVATSHLGELVRGTVPPWMEPVFYAITQLGNIGFLLVVFALDYWLGDSKRGAHAISLAIGGAALVVGLKSFFAAPRPPEEINVIPISGFAFPSGHATASTIAYGVLAYDLEIGTRRTRYGVAGLLVGLIALSRVVLGVHFVRDVVAGILVGVAFLAAAIALTSHAPRPGFLLAFGLAVGAFALSGGTADGVAVLGAAGGALIAWEFLDSSPALDSRRGRLLILVGVLPALGVVGYVSTLSGLPLLVVFVLNVGIAGGILLSPLLAERYG